MLVAALDTATLALSCALVEVEAGRPPRVVAERVERAPAKPETRRRAQGQPDEAAPARQRAPSAERGFAAGTDLERAGGGAARSAATTDVAARAVASVPPARSTGGHSAALPQALVDLLTAQGLQFPAVDAYAVGLGPGSFTGLRIGLATWKGLAYANRKPIAGGSSLAAMALAAAADAEEGTLFVPLLDAKKGEVYAGFYRARAGGVVALAPEAALPPAALVERVRALASGGERPAAFGEGFDAHADVLAPVVPRLATAVATPPAGAVAALVAERLAGAAFDAQALFALEPHYVRPSEAELKFPRGLGPGARGG